jgi:aspartokinase/homoserine dehydrogenase 1
MSAPWVVHKFGGTSLADADRYRNVAAIMRAQEGEKKAVVVSAMHKVTDALIELADLAKARDDAYLTRVDALKARHFGAVEALLPAELRQKFFDLLESDIKDIKEILRGVYLSRTYSDRTLELIAGHGELWSAQLLNAHLNATGIASSWLDARTVLTVEPGDTSVSVDWERSKSQTAEWLKELKTDWVVITGFVASTPEGMTTWQRPAAPHLGPPRS